jgi:hypothetical protein
MTDLVAIMSTLVDGQGRILIDGVYDDVAPLLPEEEQLYQRITFDTVRCFSLSTLIHCKRTNPFLSFFLSFFLFFSLLPHHPVRQPSVLKPALNKQFRLEKKIFSCIVGDIRHCHYTAFKVNSMK